MRKRLTKGDEMSFDMQIGDSGSERTAMMRNADDMIGWIYCRERKEMSPLAKVLTTAVTWDNVLRGRSSGFLSCSSR